MSADARQPSIPDAHPPSQRGSAGPPPPLRLGWSPPHDETTLEAADERARAALRGVHETRLELGDVKTELAAIAASLASLVRVFKALGVIAVPVAIAVIVDLARSAAHWLSTLHH
jgi:hypothetical protein